MKRIIHRSSIAVYLFIGLLSGAAAFAQVTPSQDAYTNSADPTTNYGMAVTLGIASSAASIQTTYIQFDLSSIPAGYTSANVAKATLKLYVNTVTAGGSFNVDFVSGAWTEKTIKASVAPALGSAIVSSVPLTSVNVHDYVLIDVTSALGAWLNGTETNDGIALVANSGLSATIDSKESTAQSHPAELDIVYNGAITGVNTAAGSGLTGGGTGGTLNLGLITSCSSGQILAWNGSAWACKTVSGTGTVKSVGSGTGLTGGPITTSGTLSIDATVVPLLAGANNFANINGISVNSSSAGLTVSNSGTGGSLWLNPGGNGEGIFVNGGYVGVEANGSLVSLWGTTGVSNAVGVEGDSSAGTGVNATGLTGVAGASTSCCSGTGGNFTGYNGVSGTGQAGTVGILATGGASDPGCCANGGDAIVANGGAGFEYGGTGIVVSGATGGQGGNGVTAYGASGSIGGVGGSFVGGSSGSAADGIDASPGTSYAYAASLNGDVVINGTVYTGAKDFRIDHPLDPGNKYLQHASVESSEMMNIYTGNVTTDAQGNATVRLPEWFEVVNTDFRYQLTVIGQFAQAIVSHKVENNQFAIRTNAPNVEVSWQITGVRQDPYAKAHPLVVEQDKEARLRGFYMHPELFGAPEEKQIEWARHPEMMKRIKEHRQAAPAVTPARMPGAATATAQQLQRQRALTNKK